MNRAQLKEEFKTGARPSGSSFASLIDSVSHTGEMSSQWQLVINFQGQGNGQWETSAAFFYTPPTENIPDHIYIIAEVDAGTLDIELSTQGGPVCEWGNLSGPLREWQSSSFIPLSTPGIVTLRAIGTGPYTIYSIYQL